MPAHPQTSNAAIVAAGRRLLEERGIDALTMRDVAAAVGVRASSLYKRVGSRTELFRLILDELADELAAAVDTPGSTGDATADLRTLMSAYRGFAHEHPVAYTLWWAPNGPPGGTERATRATSTLIGLVTEVAGSQQALLAARTLVAWAHGFITIELADGFQLRGDLDEAWSFGLDRLIAAIQPATDT